MSDDSNAWSESYSASDQLLTIEMPARDWKRIRKRAKKAGLSVENYLRQSFGFTLIQRSGGAR